MIPEPMGIEDILRENDKKRGRSDARQDAYEREFQSRFVYSENVAVALLGALLSLRDKAIGEPVRLPLAAKPSETPVFIECEGLVRLTLLSHVRSDLAGAVYCSSIELGMSRGGGRSVRASFDPIRNNSGRPSKLGVTEKHFAVDPHKFRDAIETLARQL